MFTRHGGQHLAANLTQPYTIAPSRLGHDVVQRLMLLPHLTGARSQPSARRSCARSARKGPWCSSTWERCDRSVRRPAIADPDRWPNAPPDWLDLRVGSYRPQLPASQSRMLFKSQWENRLHDTVVIEALTVCLFFGIPRIRSVSSMNRLVEKIRLISWRSCK